MEKQVLREVYKRQRLAMSRAEVQAKSRLICQKLITHTDWTKIKTVCVYMPISKLNEVDIKGLSPIFKRHGIKVYELGNAREEKAPRSKFDLIIVPCLAFDKENYRMGWGGGFYDKFLANQLQALKAGVCFQAGFIEHLPRELHDVQLDKVITEV